MNAQPRRYEGQLHGKAAVLAGVRGRCPNCGQGRLFSGWLKVEPTCEVCSFKLETVETGDGAATFIMQITGVLVGLPAVAFNLAMRPPVWVNMVLWLPLAAAVALALMRPGKGLMTSLQMLRTRPVTPPKA